MPRKKPTRRVKARGKQAQERKSRIKKLKK